MGGFRLRRVLRTLEGPLIPRSTQCPSRTLRSLDAVGTPDGATRDAPLSRGVRLTHGLPQATKKRPETGFKALNLDGCCSNSTNSEPGIRPSIRYYYYYKSINYINYVNSTIRESPVTVSWRVRGGSLAPGARIGVPGPKKQRKRVTRADCNAFSRSEAHNPIISLLTLIFSCHRRPPGDLALRRSRASPLPRAATGMPRTKGDRRCSFRASASPPSPAQRENRLATAPGRGRIGWLRTTIDSDAASLPAGVNCNRLGAIQPHVVRRRRFSGRTPWTDKVPESGLRLTAGAVRSYPSPMCPEWTAEVLACGGETAPLNRPDEHARHLFLAFLNHIPKIHIPSIFYSNILQKLCRHLTQKRGRR